MATRRYILCRSYILKESSDRRIFLDSVLGQLSNIDMI